MADVIMVVVAAVAVFALGAQVGLAINEHKIRDAICYQRGRLDGVMQERFGRGEGDGE